MTALRKKSKRPLFVWIEHQTEARFREKECLGPYDGSVTPLEAAYREHPEWRKLPVDTVGDPDGGGMIMDAEVRFPLARVFIQYAHRPARGPIGPVKAYALLGAFIFVVLSLFSRAERFVSEHGAREILSILACVALVSFALGAASRRR
jgi:hypothetical protein